MADQTVADQEEVDQNGSPSTSDGLTDLVPPSVAKRAMPLLGAAALAALLILGAARRKRR